MLAKETKIHNLIHQRNFIRAMLEAPKKDGDPAYRYSGYVYPENREYFEKEGYDITTLTSTEALKITDGLPLNIFIPCENIILTPEEETTSKRIATERINISEEFENFLNDLFSNISEEEDDEDTDFVEDPK